MACFWSTTHAEVKKGLKGRYRKHYWPENPLVASGTSQAKPRGTGSLAWYCDSADIW
ncbi:hypothetical protein GIV34_07700 [Pseudomonas sp. PA-1-6A]|uniref:ATP-dependent helicase C-terminal domain-containing protein n=1 Tax=Pseudomonas TaxID=286 RepID=UPI001FA105C4|nr:hypothetical protein [Pseudomonas sp. PA-1-8C]MCF5786798.1 hypothetical protein [Pseudomonas sp. PA-1-6G]MCF5792686.1 hypothetical protein [Pseudomonas sp. PA-1-6B]MCF5797523.1 hypothetical protein [Pseudomonas sp. PA-1-5A]MCF5833895.1 hypothetical protein [Pseudomonas sp. PA-1-6A]MCF8967238.1 hypothetical protein [Pseudomonas carnis]